MDMNPRTKKIVVHAIRVLTLRADWGGQCAAALSRLLDAWTHYDVTLGRAIKWHRRHCSYCLELQRGDDI
jgi:hypothetical protein